jgi:hypothetical protein
MELILYNLVLLGIFCAFINTNFAFVLMLVVALIADPIRKLTPAQPFYVSVAFLPILAAIYFKLNIFEKRKKIIKSFPSFRLPFYLFLFFFGASFIKPIISNANSLSVVLFGAAQYLGLFAAIKIGFSLVKDEDKITNFVKIYSILLAPFLVSVVLSYLGISSPAFNVLGFDKEMRIRWSGLTGVAMRCGLFRTPEILGWHAMVGLIGAIFLLFNKIKGIFWRIFLPIFSILSAFCIILSGRRKFFLGFIVWLIVMLIYTAIYNRKKLVRFLLVVLLLVIPGVYFINTSNQTYSKEYANVDQFTSSMNEGSKDFRQRSASSLIWAFNRDGFFGRGLGSAAQGATHLQGESGTSLPAPEEGPGKLVSDLGLLGAFSFLMLLYAYIRNIFHGIRRSFQTKENLQTVIFLISLIATFVLTFAGSHQVYGDPFVAFLTGITFGSLLAILPPSLTGNARVSDQNSAPLSVKSNMPTDLT